ncbi:MAG: energy transducer TonB [Proteobacteria bacterium]|nr:energy transducer TonB [Pseudomonadota bacterium]
MKQELARWGGSFAIVMGVHAGAVLLALGWAEATVPYAPPPAAVMLELAPLPAAPAATPDDAPPGPELSEVVPEPEPPPPVDLKPPPVKAEITLPDPEPPPPVDLKPPPHKPIEKKKVERKPPQPKQSTPQAAPEQAQTAAAPRAGASAEPPSNSLPTWKGLLLRHLEKHKRYPSDAQSRRQEGVVYMRFTLSRSGRVLAARVERSSGVASLDKEGLDLLNRAQPMPPFPPDQPGESMDLVVPIQFALRR